MARAITTLSPPCLISNFPLLPSLPSLSPPSTLSFHSHTLQTTPKLSIRRSQLDGSAGEDADNEIGRSFFDDDVILDDFSDDDDGDDTENSIDLFIRFLQAMFKKLSKRAKKASRSILPAAISSQLVSFAVDGILLLASFSIVKAFLEVACTIGGTVFVAILLLRVIWATLSYFQSSGNSSNQTGSSFGLT